MHGLHEQVPAWKFVFIFNSGKIQKVRTNLYAYTLYGHLLSRLMIYLKFNLKSVEQSNAFYLLCIKQIKICIYIMELIKQFRSDACKFYLQHVWASWAQNFGNSFFFVSVINSFEFHDEREGEAIRVHLIPCACSYQFHDYECTL